MTHDGANRAVMGGATGNTDDSLRIENLTVLQE